MWVRIPPSVPSLTSKEVQKIANSYRLKLVNIPKQFIINITFIIENTHKSENDETDIEYN